MPDNTVPMPAPTPPTPVVEDKPIVIDKETYQLEEVRFRKDSNLEGLSYYVLQFKNTTEDDASKSLATMLAINEDGTYKKWKPSQVVAIINSAIRSAQRTKAQNEVLNKVDKTQVKAEYEKRLLHNPVLLTAEDCEKWVPGEREATIQGMMRQVVKLMNEGQVLEAQKLMLEINKKIAEEVQAAEAV